MMSRSRTGTLIFVVVCLAIAATYGYTRLAHYTMNDLEVLIHFWPRWVACVGALLLAALIAVLLEHYD